MLPLEPLNLEQRSPVQLVHEVQRSVQGSSPLVCTFHTGIQMFRILLAPVMSCGGCILFSFSRSHYQPVAGTQSNRAPAGRPCAKLNPGLRRRGRFNVRHLYLCSSDFRATVAENPRCRVATVFSRGGKMDTYLAGHTAGLSISEPYLLTLCRALALLKSLRSDQLVRHI